MPKWLDDLRQRPVAVSFSWAVSFLTAGGDRCLECNVRRDEHPKTHKFKEAR